MSGNNIGFKLVGIKTEQFAIMEDSYSEKKNVGFGSGFQFKVKRSEHRIGVYSTFQFEQGKNTFIKLVVSCHFEIKDTTWMEFIEGESIRVPAGFARHLAMLTVGTSRGILHCKTEGTPFNVFLLPTINVTEVVKKDVLFN